MNMDELLNDLANTRQEIVTLTEQEKILKAKKDDLETQIIISLKAQNKVDRRAGTILCCCGCFVLGYNSS